MVLLSPVLTAPCPADRSALLRLRSLPMQPMKAALPATPRFQPSMSSMACAARASRHSWRVRPVCAARASGNIQTHVAPALRSANHGQRGQRNHFAELSMMARQLIKCLPECSGFSAKTGWCAVTSSDIRVRHNGNVVERIDKGPRCQHFQLEQIAHQREAMQGVSLNPGEQSAFVMPPLGFEVRRRGRVQRPLPKRKFSRRAVLKIAAMTCGARSTASGELAERRIARAQQD